ncbi:AMP-binding protein [Rarobacter incanus]|uniref:AMP-binding protein n=1 Tax=Rarobacter incanus TaxID=153494 RepID=UPI0014769782|nr:AMP-binding protein [Rarobacter incanus]
MSLAQPPEDLRTCADPARLARAVAAGASGAVIVTTSGSTSGTGARVLLAHAALVASARATLDHLTDAGAWLLCLPARHIAGFQVLVRAHLSAAPLATMDPASSFTPAAFAHAAASLPAGRRTVSLVPTQLFRILGDAEATRALASFDHVLVGGAALDLSLAARAAAAGINVTTTYGMTETCGGCVYNGIPLPGVEVRTDADGRIHLRGRVLASGYVDAAGRIDEATTAAHLTKDGWWRTNDVGTWDGHRLRVAGRADDVIVTGGHNVVPSVVEDAIRAHLHDPQAQVVVVGVPDPQWGQRVTAVIARGLGREIWDEARARAARQSLRGALAPQQVPHSFIDVPEFPVGATGKVDRRWIAAAASAALDASY